jgi:hypothetical protein
MHRLDQWSTTEEHIRLPTTELHPVFPVPSATLDEPLPVQP